MFSRCCCRFVSQNVAVNFIDWKARRDGGTSKKSCEIGAKAPIEPTVSELRLDRAFLCKIKNGIKSLPTGRRSRSSENRTYRNAAIACRVKKVICFAPRHRALLHWVPISRVGRTHDRPARARTCRDDYYCTSPGPRRLFP